MGLHRAALTTLALVALLASARQAAAQAPGQAADPPGYREAIEAAIAEHEAGHFAESRALFGRAHDIAPSARTLRGMGMAEFELRNYPQSAALLEQALVSTVKPLRDELRARTEALLQRARTFVGYFQVTLQPDDAVLSVDGQPAALDGGTLALPVGDHALVATADGHERLERELRVGGGEHEQLTLKLEPEPELEPQTATAPTPAQTASAASPATAPTATAATASRPPAARATESDDDGSIFSSPWLWATLGVVVAGGVVGAVVLTSDDPTTASTYGGSSGAVLRAP